MRTHRTASLIFTVVVLALVVAACGGESAAPESTPTVAAPSPSEISREDAAEQYLKLAKPVNVAIREYDERARVFDASGSERSFAAVKTAAGKLGKALRTHARQLREAQWPAEARTAVEQVARLDDAQAYGFEELSKARTVDAWYDITVPPDDGSADLVRAHLGLEARR